MIKMCLSMSCLGTKTESFVKKLFRKLRHKLIKKKLIKNVSKKYISLMSQTELTLVAENFFL